MKHNISNIAILVHDYDEAIEFYTQSLSFEIKANVEADDGHRWVQLAPANATGCHLIFDLATEEADRQIVGKQAGTKVLAILETDDFWRDYRQMKNKGLKSRQTKSELNIHPSLLLSLTASSATSALSVY